MNVLAALGSLAQRVFLALDRMEHKLDVLIKLIQAKEDKQYTPSDQLAFDRFCPVCFQKIVYTLTTEGPVGVTVRSCGCTSKAPQVVIREGEE